MQFTTSISEVLFLRRAFVLDAPVKELAPKDDLSATEIDKWNQFDGPEPGYGERVYFAELHADESSCTTALLRSQNSDQGIAVSFNINQLPKFILWKNTAALSDGYVVGLEPATNFPNPPLTRRKSGTRYRTTTAGNCFVSELL